MKILIIILAVIAVCLLGTAIHAVFFKEKKTQEIDLPPEKVDVERAAEHLSNAIQIKTVSHDDPGKVDWAEFEKFHNFWKVLIRL